jgi:1-acyl-sn-glycerol-3-phosphate acyltransferase
MPSDPGPEIRAFAAALDRFGRAWNRYEIQGFEHIPRDRACLLVVYHAFMPLDGWYFAARSWVDHGLFLHALADRFLFKTPGLGRMMTAGGAIPGEPESALELLQTGAAVMVSPGGVREAIAGRNLHYRVLWGERTGFARLALRANVPCIPVFGENSEETYRSPGVHLPPFQALYEHTRVPIVPVAGLGALPFPVKLTTWVGEPVEPRPDDTPEALRDRVRTALQALIDAHQHRRPRLLRGIAARLAG